MMNNEYIQKYASKIATITHYIQRDILPEVWNHKSLNSEPYIFLSTLIFKTNNALDTANILTNNLINKGTVIDSLFLILRTSISDLIIYIYLLNISKDDDDFIKNINRMYFDHIKYALRGMNQKEEKEFKALYPQYFDEHGKEIIEPLKLSVTKMVNKILSIENINELKVAEILYNKFSKYEHLGILTRYLIHRQFKTDKIKEIFEDIYSANKIIFFILKNVIGAFVKEDSLKYIELERLIQDSELAIETQFNHNEKK